MVISRPYILYILRQRFHVTGSVTFWERIGLAFSRNYLEQFCLELLVGSKCSAFEIGPTWNCTRVNEWNGSKWARLGKRSSKKSDWHTSSALLLFPCTPANQLSLAQFSNINSKWNRSLRNARPIHTQLLRFQMEPSSGNAVYV